RARGIRLGGRVQSRLQAGVRHAARGLAPRRAARAHRAGAADRRCGRIAWEPAREARAKKKRLGAGRSARTIDPDSHPGRDAVRALRSLAFVASCMPFCALGQVFDWTGAIDTAWSTPGNWNGGIVPTNDGSAAVR